MPPDLSRSRKWVSIYSRSSPALGVEIKFVAGLNVRLDATGPCRDHFSNTDTKQY